MPGGITAECAAAPLTHVGKAPQLCSHEANTGRATVDAEFAKLSSPLSVGHNPTVIAGSSGAPTAVALRVPWAKRSCAKRAE